MPFIQLHMTCPDLISYIFFVIL